MDFDTKDRLYIAIGRLDELETKWDGISLEDSLTLAQIAYIQIEHILACMRKAGKKHGPTVFLKNINWRYLESDED